MRFTEEPMIQQGLEEIEELQKKVLELVKLLTVQPEDEELAIEYLHTLHACVDKEHIMYTRLELCDNNEEAQRFKAHLDEEARKAGMPEHLTVSKYCTMMKEDIKKKLSLLGQELEENVDVDFFNWS